MFNSKEDVSDYCQSEADLSDGCKSEEDASDGTESEKDASDGTESEGDKKWRRQKQIDSTSNKLMLLLQQKDQKIKQLSLQISQMNECLLTRRKVPVLQVG